MTKKIVALTFLSLLAVSTSFAADWAGVYEHTEDVTWWEKMDDGSHEQTTYENAAVTQYAFNPDGSFVMAMRYVKNHPGYSADADAPVWSWISQGVWMKREGLVCLAVYDKEKTTRGSFAFLVGEPREDGLFIKRGLRLQEDLLKRIESLTPEVEQDQEAFTFWRKKLQSIPDELPKFGSLTFDGEEKLLREVEQAVSNGDAMKLCEMTDVGGATTDPHLIRLALFQSYYSYTASPEPLMMERISEEEFRRHLQSLEKVNCVFSEDVEPQGMVHIGFPSELDDGRVGRSTGFNYGTREGQWLLLSGPRKQKADDNVDDDTAAE